jgi:3-oxoacyl-[acyl-carrier protein] reductase
MAGKDGWEILDDERAKVKNIRDYEKKLPSGKIGDPAEIGKFIKFIVENKIKYINGSTIYFDGNINNSII